eukprot:COSAG06_NODE_40947_length_396_cov_2.531987_1_plen_34_part_01
MHAECVLCVEVCAVCLRRPAVPARTQKYLKRRHR